MNFTRKNKVQIVGQLIITADAHTDSKVLHALTAETGTRRAQDESVAHNVEFYNCESLKKLTLPETLLHIGDSAFKGCSQLDPFELPAQLQYIGRDAFRDAAIDVVRLPKTMMRVERSAFAGARELIVYDNIEPDAVEADQWNFDSLNGTINAPFACALISIWSKSADNIGSTDWKGFHITVLSAQTDQVKYRIYCDGSEHHEYLALMFSAWGRYASFKFLEYDNFFGKLSNATTRIETAFCRLQFPFGLAAHHREEYETYLQQATYFQTNATLVAEAIADKDEVERLQMLLDLRALSQRNTDWLMSIFQEAKATKCINLLQQSKI